jgi:hypothetical protein
LTWPLSSLLNVVYTVMVEGADSKEREKFDAKLNAPIEGSAEARAESRRARFELAQQSGAIDG